MRRRLPTPILRPVLLAGLFAAAGLGFAAEGARSPFMPAAGAAAAAPTAGAPLEYRGYIESSEGVQFRIYSPTRKAGVWVRLNERNAEFDVTAKSHGENYRTLTLEHEGRTITLAEREAKVVSAGSAAAMPPPAAVPAPAANVAPAVTQSVVLNPTPADEQRRLEAVASEVARRRALREQAAQQIQAMPAANAVPAGAPAGRASPPPPR